MKDSLCMKEIGIFIFWELEAVAYVCVDIKGGKEKKKNLCLREGYL